MNIRELLNEKVQQAMAAASIPAGYGAHVAPGKKAGFGDYQANGAMAAAKAMKTNPRELAQAIVSHLQLDAIAEKVEIAGPGFINIHLHPRWLAERAEAALGSARVGIEPVAPQTVVVDYSAPNLAKEMHVGHLRSTIIGDALARILTFLGHHVIRQNHVGDWGTQFGMLIAELEESLQRVGIESLQRVGIESLQRVGIESLQRVEIESLQRVEIESLGEGERADFALQDLEAFYQQAKRHFDADSAFADRARDYVVKLQSGDAGVLKLWQQFREISLQHGEEIYRLLNVTLTRDHVQGESAYNNDLPVLVRDLKERGLAVEDQGALVMFLPELADKEGKPYPMIVQKQSGGYLYATTDLAAIRYRVGALKADRIMYFIDARQGPHMQQIFTAARKAGYVDERVSLEHHPFGTMMSEDGKPFKTRSGGTVKLSELLREAVQRAEKIIDEKNPELPPEERREVARKVGIGAVKYADLSKTRTNDYVFSWNAMLSFEGNTAPYLQYAYTRVQSIFRKAGVAPEQVSGNIAIEAEQERALALKLLQFSEVIEQVAREAYPHVLCGFLYDVASLFMSFYEACPILKEGVPPATRGSRLQLCKLAARTLHTGLDLLGIETMERM